MSVAVATSGQWRSFAGLVGAVKSDVVIASYREIEMRTLKECHEVIQRAIGQPPTAIIPHPRSGPASKLADLVDAHGLTIWEQEFLDSIEDVIGMGWALSPNQQDTLDRIWRERT